MEPMRIELQHQRPIFQNPRRMSERERVILDEHYPELLTAKIIAPCDTTHYAVNSVVVPKKGPTGEWTGARVCQVTGPSTARQCTTGIRYTYLRSCGAEWLHQKHQFLVRLTCAPAFSSCHCIQIITMSLHFGGAIAFISTCVYRLV